MRGDKRASNSNSGADRGQAESPAQHHSEDIASLRSQREANGDLAFLFVDEIGNRPVDSEPGKQQGGGCERRHDLHRKASDRKRIGEDLIQSLGMEDGKVRVDGLDLLAHLRWDGAGIELSAKK